MRRVHWDVAARDWRAGAHAGGALPIEQAQDGGKYSFCRLKAESKAVKTGNPADFSKCDGKFSLKWGQAESAAGMGVCPSEGDEADLQAFITQHASDVAAALAGGPLPDCPLDLATCSGSLSTCSTDLTTCNGDLTTCNGNYASCAADLATVRAGSAVQADVLSGKTFSSGSGLGLAGTMPNNGAVMLTPARPIRATPRTANQSIAAGYHDGAGFCAGDADLLATNVVSGVNLFGVSGTALPAQRLKTGQTICYDAAGAVIACAGTGAGRRAAEGRGGQLHRQRRRHHHRQPYRPHVGEAQRRRQHPRQGHRRTPGPTRSRPRWRQGELRLLPVRRTGGAELFALPQLSARRATSTEGTVTEGTVYERRRF